MMLYIGYLLAVLVVRLLPLKICYWIATRVADLWYLLAPGRRKALMHNLSLLPQPGCDTRQLRQLARRIMRNFAHVVTEFLYLPRLNRSKFEDLVDVKGFESLRMLTRGERAILITAHLGNWELGAAALAMLGLDLHVVVYDHPDRRIARLFRKYREQKGLAVMSIKEAARRIRGLPRGSCIGIVADRDYTGRGLKVSMFGVRTTVPSGYAHLAISEKIPVIAGFCLKGTDGRYHLELAGTIYNPEQAIKSHREIVESFIEVLEKSIAKYPEQWYFFEKLESNGEPYVL